MMTYRRKKHALALASRSTSVAAADCASPGLANSNSPAPILEKDESQTNVTETSCPNPRLEARVYGMNLNPEPDFDDEEKRWPYNCRGGYLPSRWDYLWYPNEEPKPFEDTEMPWEEDMKMSSDEDKNSVVGDGPESTDENCFTNLGPVVRASGLDDPLDFDGDSEEMTFTDSEPEDEKQPIPDTESFNLNGRAEIETHDFNVPSPSEMKVEEELTFTDSESEDEEPAAVESNFLNAPAESENGQAVTIKDNGAEVVEMTFTDSESEDEEPAAAESENGQAVTIKDNGAEVVEMTFTDSESEDEEPAAAESNTLKTEHDSKKEVQGKADRGAEDGELSNFDTSSSISDSSRRSGYDADLRGELSFSDSEPTPTRPNNVRNSASEVPGLEELTFTDSESEEEN